MSTEEVEQKSDSSVLPHYSVPASQTYVVTTDQSVSQDKNESSALSAEPLAQDLSSLVSNALTWACSTRKETLTQTWLRAANALSYQHKHQDISLLDASLLSKFVAWSNSLSSRPCRLSGQSERPGQQDAIAGCCQAMQRQPA